VWFGFMGVGGTVDSELGIWELEFFWLFW